MASIPLTYRNIDFLGCDCCERLNSPYGKPILESEKGTCISPKEGCIALMRGLDSNDSKHRMIEA